MSYGKMNGFAVIKKIYKEQDDEGFRKDTELIIATARCYREGRHGSLRWANLATFSEATDLFRFRCIPDTEIVADMVILCGSHRFEITSVENIKGRGMYMEVLCKEVKPGG